MSMFRKIMMRGLSVLGLAPFLVRKHRKRGAVPILLFHRVSPEPDPFWDPLPPEAFRDTLRLFARYYRFLPLEALLDEEELSPDAAFITFDDAFKDVEEYAVPILGELGFPATIFVPTGSIDEQKAIWPSLVDRALEKAWDKEEELLQLGNERFEIGEMRSMGKEKAGGVVKERIMQAPYEVQMRVRETLIGHGYSERVAPMSWEGLNALPSSISLGAHTVHHPYLPSLTDEREIENEMRDSKERLESMTSKKVCSFAYPFGGHDERSRRLAAEYFELAFTTEACHLEKPLGKEGSALHALPRRDVQDVDPHEALLRTNGFHQYLGRVLKGK
ncbi:MAG: polysaccharide deacetylase family protein [Flavobacteriales bacterium]